MTDELDKILGEKDGEAPLDDPEKKEPEKKPEVKDPEVLSKEQQLANINKAIGEANTKLKEIRKKGKDPEDDDDEDDLKIDLKDPNSKAWDKHISEKVDPVSQALDAETKELFKFTLKDFLGDKPALLANTDKLRKIIQTYERIKDNSGRTKEGILEDLQRAYSAENYEELAGDPTKRRIDKARKDAIYSDAGVSRGGSSYLPDREIAPEYTEQDSKILAKWGMTPDSHAQMIKELNDKKTDE